MPDGPQDSVLSHRRGGLRGRAGKVAFWTTIAVVTSLALTGITFGYRYVAGRSCSGKATATVIAAPGMSTMLEGLARAWQQTAPAVHGRCVSVDIEAKDSALMAQALGVEWDAKSLGVAPDVWVPESTTWARRAATASVAEYMIPDQQPSLARTPTVLAMPKPMAEALGWPTASLSWQDITDKFATTAEGWARYGKDWGPLRFGMTDPQLSTPGMNGLLAVLDPNNDGAIAADEQPGAVRLNQIRAVYADTTDKIFAELAKADAQGSDAALRYVSAFPALEHEILSYNQHNPKVPLVAFYPSNAATDADYPYLVLDADWASAERKDAANAFLAYVQRSNGRETFLSAGYRDANRAGGGALTVANGLSPQLPPKPRTDLPPDVVRQSVDAWTALTRPTNVLLVLDVSGSMSSPVPGTGKTKLQVAQEAAHNAVNLFTDDARAGLWSFAVHLDGDRDYKQLVPIGVVSEGGRRAGMHAAIDALTPSGNTGLYNTIAAAQQAVVDNYQPGASNLVVLLTDGTNENEFGGLTLEQLKTKLVANNADAKHRVPVVTIGYGEDADFGTLQDISRATGAVSYSAKNSVDISQVLLTAIFGRT
jgi:Ca-activated chloride channel family protein